MDATATVYMQPEHDTALLATGLIMAAVAEWKRTDAAFDGRRLKIGAGSGYAALYDRCWKAALA